jgi:hypothetical protein
MARNFAPTGAKPSIHGMRLALTEHGRLFQRESGADLGGVFPMLALSATAASTAISNTTTETAFSNASFTIPANWLRAGSIIRFGWQGIATSTNSTDTLQIKAYVGSTAVATGTATDVADNNVFAGEATVSIRTIGSSGTFVANASHTKAPAASLTASRVDEITASTTLDTTATVTISVKATWGAQSASDSCRNDIFWITVT